MIRVTWHLDDLRTAVGEVEALADLALKSFDRADWSGVADELLVERMGYVLGILAASATATVSKLKRLQATIAAAQSAPAGERRNGTAPGEETAMSAQDAEIVRRIRELCPDNRFDGGSDAELLDLFKRNKQVLSRSDADVISAMTRPR